MVKNEKNILRSKNENKRMVKYNMCYFSLENYDLNQKLNNIPKQNQNKYFEDCKKRWFDFWLPLEYKQGHKTFEEFYGTVSQYVWKECKVFY